MSSAQGHQTNESEERLNKLDQDMRRLTATVQELAEAVRESRTRRVDSSASVEENTEQYISAEDGILDSGVAGIDSTQQGMAQDELLPGDLRHVTRRSGLAPN